MSAVITLEPGREYITRCGVRIVVDRIDDAIPDGQYPAVCTARILLNRDGSHAMRREHPLDVIAAVEPRAPAYIPNAERIGT